MKTPGEALRVILVGNDMVTLTTLRERIRSASDLEIAAETRSLDNVFGIITDMGPDVVVMDVTTSGEEGVEQIQQLRSAFPAVHIVAVSSVADALFAERIIRAGALGFVVLPDGLESIPTAIQSVARENAFVSRRIASSILTRMMQPPDEHPSTKLSRRELEVFELLASFNTDQISERLGVSRRTVMGYCSRIRRKLNVRSSSELIAYARRCHSEHV